MNSDNLQKSIVLITSTESNNNGFGTGVLIRKVGGVAYVLTCSHVVRDVGGEKKVKVDNNHPAKVIASGENYGLDLAILEVDGLVNKLEINQERSDQRESCFITAGFQQLYDNDRNYLIRTLQGTLGEAVKLQPKGKDIGGWIEAWDLCIDGNYSLQPGFSGSPIIERVSGRLLGIVSHRQGEGRRGLAISFESLNKIWTCIDRKQLYRLLTKLGYREQVRLFHTLVTNNHIAALLIHGLPGFGQGWLLNLLLSRHLPYITTSRVIKVDFTRRSQRFDNTSLWRQICTHIHLPTNSSMEEIIKRVCRCCETQNMILIFHSVNWIVKENLEKIIQDFWLPLAKARKVQNSQLTSENSKKLLMFLVDYEGSVGSLECLSDSTKADSIHTPAKIPEIKQFSVDDLLNWISSLQNDELPGFIIKEIDTKIDEILNDSDEGVPELTLAEICSKFKYNWYEESEKWLTY